MGVVYTNNSPASGSASIESRQQFASAGSSDQGAYGYWCAELKSAQGTLERWHKQADRVNQRYLDERLNASTAQPTGERSAPYNGFRLNLFYANIITLQSLLYGDVPQIDVSRRHADPADDVGRVAAEILERLLNNDAQSRSQEYDAVLRAVLHDRLVPGLGLAKIRYAVTISDGRVVAESVPLDYFHWRDVLWGWARTFAEVNWIAFRSFLTKAEFEARFPAVKIDQISFKQRKMITANNRNDTPDDPANNDNWLTAEVWEIWDKTKRELVHLHFDHDTVLDTTPDPLGLTNFYPTPPLFLANATTSLYRPTPDFHLAQDLYNEVDKIQTRIAIITEACKVVGLYDASSPEVQRMFKEGVENELIPVARWAMFAEKGGLQGAVSWFPIQEVVAALGNLRQIRDETVALLYQITGFGDIMRGSLDNQYEGVGQSQLKTKFGSIRVQALQEQYATYATGLMALKAEVIALHFEPETIIEQANMERSLEPPERIQAAVQLIKSPRQARLRVVIKAESLAMVDWNQLKTERTEYLTALATFMQSAAPLIAQEPAVGPFLLQLLQWGLAAFRGGDEIEGVIDSAIEQIKQAREEQQQQQQQEPPPDPELLKLQAQQQLEEQKAQTALTLLNTKTENVLRERQADLLADLQTRQAEHRMAMAERQAELEVALAEIAAKAQVDVAVERATSTINQEQSAAVAEHEVHKDQINHALEIDKIRASAAARIQESTASAGARDRARKPVAAAAADEDQYDDDDDDEDTDAAADQREA